MILTDVLIIGAGAAGASLGYRLAGQRRVTLLEAEDQPGYHSTGRSAALYTATYGHAVIRALTLASRDFLLDPPDGFAEVPLMRPRRVLWIGREDQKPSLAAELAQAGDLADACSVEHALALCPALKPGYVAGALLEREGYDIDVAALHQGYLAGFRRAGGALVCGARVTAIRRAGGGWEVSADGQTYACEVVVNAAGAWADEIAELAGLPRVGLAPKRRTAITFDPPAGVDVSAWPCVLDADEQFYFRPDAGRIFGSPADETPSPPCDAQPEDLDVAIAADRIETATTLEVARIAARWAGLRTFAADKVPVVGMDPDAPGFFWLAGQGGYGIMTSPALSGLAAQLILSGSLPAASAGGSVTAGALSPARFL
ncbi:MAG TPA: FAD-binding oxidoreductase [Caulobacteraceae bacterium]|nr:FAD-binding oxidoreductase [Caulobacteraceae bacterium]